MLFQTLLLVLLSLVLGCAVSTPVSPATPTPGAIPGPEPTAERPGGPADSLQEQGRLAAQQMLLMYRSLSPSVAVSDVIRAIGESGDASLIFPLVEMLLYGYGGTQAGEALEKLSGLRREADPYGWAEWLWEQDGLELPGGFDGWKGKFLRRVSSSNYKIFIYNGVKTRIPLSEIIWGGVGIDGVPDLTNPPMIPASQATYLKDDDRVFGVALNGVYQAYPLWMMARHEIANVIVGGAPVTLAYSSLSGSGILYRGESGANRFAFSTSGLVYQDNTLMYDRGSRTLWSQFSGVPVVGRLADGAIRLEMLPLTLTTWREWRHQHPDTTVVDVKTGFQTNRDSELLYADYVAQPDTMFPLAIRDHRLGTKEWVFAIRFGDRPKAYPLKSLRRELVVNDTIAGRQLVLVLEPTSSAVRAYLGGGHTFQPGAQLEAAGRVATSRDRWNIPQAEDVAEVPDLILIDEKGHEWLIKEEALTETSTAEELARVPGHMAYWFAWYAFFPQTTIYELK